MRVVNRPMVNGMARRLVEGEMSNLAMVLQTPTIFVRWYSIDAEMSEVIRGYKTVQDYIGPQSTMIYDRIEGVPMYGIDNLISTSQYSEEIAGFEEDFQSSGVIYPNTIFPRPGDFFIIDSSFGGSPALYMVTDVRPVTVKSNPFIEVQFRLFSRDQDTMNQLNRQVKDDYEVVMNAIGSSRSLVLSKKAKADIDSHARNYREICELYAMLFYDRRMAAFVFDGLPAHNGPGAPRCKYVDLYLWKLMFDEGIIVYDELANYADADNRSSQKIYISTPNVFVDDYAFTRSILWRIYEQGGEGAIVRKDFDEYRFPHLWEPTQRITKYNGLNIWYIDSYDNVSSLTDYYGDFYLWDNEFICRIRNDEKYEEFPITSGVCYGCENHCVGAPVRCYNPYLRNAIIAHVNGEEIDWDRIQISDDRTIENYYLIPMVLGMYKKFIQAL